MKHDWIQIIGLGTVVVGLVMVVFELQQNRNQAEAQMILDDWLSLHDHRYTLMGDNPAAAIIKARNNPGDLTDEERFIVDAHLRVEYERVGAYEFIWKSTGVFGSGWEDSAPAMLNEYFDYSYAREWIKKHQQIGQSWGANFSRYINDLIAESEIPDQPNQ